jgi:hypothetical protein
LAANTSGFCTSCLVEQEKRTVIRQTAIERFMIRYLLRIKDIKIIEIKMKKPDIVQYPA